MSIFRQLIDEKIIKILDLLLKNKKELFHLSKISNKTKIPVSSTFRIINQLISINVIDVITVGKTKIYRIADNNKTKELEFALKKNKK